MNLPLENTRQSNFIRPPSNLENFSLKKGDESFQRIEDKFIVAKDQVAELIKLINDNMIPSYLDSQTHFNLIESVYFDSPNKDFFCHHFNKNLKVRYKLRLRRYAPNGQWEEAPYLLELKAKELGVSKKTRFRITSSQYQNLLAGLPLGEVSEEMEKLNPNLGLKKLQKRINKVNELQSQYSLRPALKVVYRRLAFESQEFRVTLDGEIAGEEFSPTPIEKFYRLKENDFWPEMQEMRRKFTDENTRILELKHSGVIPPWMQKFLDNKGWEKASFSKYCFFTVQGAHAKMTFS